MKMANPHLFEVDTVFGIFKTVISSPATEPKPNGFDLGTDFSSCPVRKAVIGHHTSQVLEVIIFIFYRTFEPILRILIKDNSTLVKSSMTTRKIRLHSKGKIVLLRFHLQDRSIVIHKMVIGLLPQIRLGVGGNGNFFI